MPHFTDVIETLYKDLKRKSNVYKEFVKERYPYETKQFKYRGNLGNVQYLVLPDDSQRSQGQLVDLEGFLRMSPEDHFQIIARTTRFIGNQPRINSSLLYSNEDSNIWSDVAYNKTVLPTLNSFSRFKPYGEFRVLNPNLEKLKHQSFEISSIKNWETGPNFRKYNEVYEKKNDGYGFNYDDDLIHTLFQVVENDLAGRTWLPVQH